MTQINKPHYSKPQIVLDRTSVYHSMFVINQQSKCAAVCFAVPIGYYTVKDSDLNFFWAPKLSAGGLNFGLDSQYGN